MSAAREKALEAALVAWFANTSKGWKAAMVAATDAYDAALPPRRVLTVHDWELPYSEAHARGYTYARTPERAEALTAEGVKLTPVYTVEPDE